MGDTSSVKRIVLLALDALDYYLVDKWRMVNLKQEIYGKFDVDRRYYHWREPVPFSPTIWCTIATGEPPESHGVRDWWRYKGVLERLRYLPLIRHIRGKRRILWRLGIKPKIVDKKVVKTTLFDRIAGANAVYFPCYNDSSELHERLSKAINRGVREYIEEVWRVHLIRKKAFLEVFNSRGWRLLAGYFDIADLLGHVCFRKCRLQLLKAYISLDRLAASIRKGIDRQTLVLIISDHGMALSGDGVSGNHTGYAFWSMNMDIGMRIRDFLDIPMIIERILID